MRYVGERIRHVDIKPSTDNANLYIVYWVLLLDGQTELETLRKIRKAKCIPTMTDVLWRRARTDYELRFVALELMFEVCRSERLSDEDLGEFSIRTFINNRLYH